MPKLLLSLLTRSSKLLSPTPHPLMKLFMQPSVPSPPPCLHYELLSDPPTNRQRDDLLHSLLSSDPSKLQAVVRKAKTVGEPALHLSQVGKHTYTALVTTRRVLRGLFQP